MKRKTILLCCCVIAQLFFSYAIAQGFEVSRKITNRSTGENLSGATVTVKGTTNGTLTDTSGIFKIKVPGAGSVLVITYVGMIDQEVVVTSATMPIAAQLEPRANSLNEVVVIGYGTQKRATVTGAISSVKARDLENVPNGRIEQALEGRVSGVTVMQNSGQPGSSSTIRVRGITTFNNNNPLWVVDGVVVDAGGIGYICLLYT